MRHGKHKMPMKPPKGMHKMNGKMMKNSAMKKGKKRRGY